MGLFNQSDERAPPGESLTTRLFGARPAIEAALALLASQAPPANHILRRAIRSWQKADAALSREHADNLMGGVSVASTKA